MSLKKSICPIKVYKKYEDNPFCKEDCTLSMLFQIKALSCLMSLVATGSFWVKNRSLGQIKKAFKDFRDRIYCPVFMKLGKNNFLNNSLAKFETGSHGVKKLGQ